jgi:glycerate 2-kinase
MADGATIVGLIAVDEVEGKPWGPTVFDSSAPSDGIKILQDFNLFEKIPLSVKEYLVKEELKKKITRETGFQHNGQSPYNFVIADNSLLCKAAQDTASKFGIKSFLLSTSIRGEAKDVGRVIASISKEISRFRRPFEPPCIIVAGGETTVTIVGKSGKGGRNQEMALSAAQDIEGLSNIVIASVATDGIDGPTGIAGAIVDGTTMKNVEEKGLSIVRELSCHNSSYVLEKISDAIYTFDTATNLMDLILVYIS